MFAHPFFEIKQLHVKRFDSCQMILHMFGLMYCCFWVLKMTKNLLVSAAESRVEAQRLNRILEL